MTVLWSSHTLVSELVALPLTDHVKSVHEWFLKIQEKYAFLRVNFASQVSGCALKVDKGRKATQKVLTCQNLLDYWMEWTGEAGGLFSPGWWAGCGSWHHCWVALSITVCSASELEPFPAFSCQLLKPTALTRKQLQGKVGYRLLPCPETFVGQCIPTSLSGLQMGKSGCLSSTVDSTDGACFYGQRVDLQNIYT